MKLTAIFINSIRLLLRQRLSLSLLCAFFLGLPLLSYYFFVSDGTLAGVIKTIITFNFYIGSFTLMALTLYLSFTVLDSELQEGQMTLTISKPVARWKILLGKWMAVGALTGLLTLLNVVGQYLAIHWRSTLEATMELRLNSPDTQRMTDAERVEDAKVQIAQANVDVLNGRIPFYPKNLSIDEELQQALRNIEAQNIPEDKRPSPQEIRLALYQMRKSKTLPITFGAFRNFEFNGLPQTNQPLTLRYQLNGTREVGNLKWVQARWIIDPQNKTQPYVHETDSQSGTTRTFYFPPEYVDKDGKLLLYLGNISGPTKTDSAAILQVPMRNGIQILVPGTGFFQNMLRGGVILWIRLLMIAGIGVCASTFLSGSVTAFLIIGVIAIGTFNNPITDSLKPNLGIELQSDFSVNIYVARKLLALLPDFNETSPVDLLCNGISISWWRILRQFFFDILLRTGIFAVIGTYAFYRRQIGIPRIFR